LDGFPQEDLMAQSTEERTNVPVTTTPPPVGRRNRLALFEDLADEVTRIWGQTWPLLPRPLLRPMTRLADIETTWAPRVDVFEKSGEIVVKAELPGVEKEDVKVSIQDDDLLIEGERHAEKEIKEEDYYRMERAYGSFYRRLPMPTGVTADQIKASFTDGVLEIRIPKPAQAEPRAHQIPIR
jgi:HSP20 family protein